MIAPLNPPRNGEGDQPKAGGGGSASLHHPATYRARKLRREMSPPEVVLWQQIRGNKTGFKFRRQHRIGPYVVDFYCASARLAVEVDGLVHDTGDRAKRDEMRDRFLFENRYDVLRLIAADVLRDPITAVEAIVARVSNPLHHDAARRGPPPRAGEDGR